MKCKGRRNPDHEKSTGNCGSDPAGRRSERYCRGRMPTAEIRPLRDSAGPVTGAMPSGSPDGEPRRDRTTGMDKDWGNPDGRRHGCTACACTRWQQKPVPVVTLPVACFCVFSRPSKGFRTVVSIFPAALPKPEPPRLRLSELTICTATAPNHAGPRRPTRAKLPPPPSTTCKPTGPPRHCHNGVNPRDWHIFQ